MVTGTSASSNASWATFKSFLNFPSADSNLSPRTLTSCLCFSVHAALAFSILKKEEKKKDTSCPDDVKKKDEIIL